MDLTLDDVLSGYDLIVDDGFDGLDLDPTRWLPYHLPQWSSRARAAARYDLHDGTLRLRIDADQQPWCPEFDIDIRDYHECAAQWTPEQVLRHRPLPGVRATEAPMKPHRPSPGSLGGRGGR